MRKGMGQSLQTVDIDLVKSNVHYFFCKLFSFIKLVKINQLKEK